jgi:hypothetical protein
MTMDHARAQPLLHPLVDEELLPEQRESVQAHLERCDECSAEVEFLLSLRARAQALPKEIAPPRDLWDGIAMRLEARPPVDDVPVIPITRSVKVERARWQRWGSLAAAAAVIVVVSSSVTMRLMQQPGAPVVALGPQQVVQPHADSRPLTALAAFQPTEREYLGTLAELEAEFQARRGSLSPETLAVVEENLRIIDGAIAEIRRALEADASSVDLPLLLSGVYRSKVDLLESTLRLYSQT